MKHLFGAAAIALFGSMSAQAELVYLGAQSFSGTGLGAVNTVLTLQSPGRTTFEAGGVGRVVGNPDDVITGDAKTGASQTQTLTLGELSLFSATDLRLVFNASEPNNPASQSILLADLRLNIYSAAGALLFTSGDFMPQNFPSTFAGTGNSGFVFGLDAEQAAQAQAAAFGAGSAGNRIGVYASLADATGGLETFYVTAVPEPATNALFLAGLAITGLLMRRRQR